MNIVEYWAKQVELWQEEQKCGLCWQFGAPLVNSQVNVQDSENPCCFNVMLINPRPFTTKVRNPITNLVLTKTCGWRFTLLIMTESPLGLNNWNEKFGHAVSESKWSTIFNKVYECFDCDEITNACEILGYDVLVDQIGDAELLHNYLDSNYNGWRFNFSFTIKR